jgi:RNA polymerase sigma-70 factor (ECF subfamily)
MPMSEPHQDRSLLRLWQAGDQGAARELFERYCERLLALARRRISQRLASRVDAEDVVQSVFRTFFDRAKAGQFTIQDPDDICKLLARITVHKTLRQIAFHKAAKRDPSSEAGQGAEGQERLLEVLDREPTPEAANAFVDQLEHFLGQLRPEDRQILELRMQGYNNLEIAEKLNVSDRKIRRLMERVRGLAEREGLAAS